MDGTVARMRRVRKVLEDRGTDAPCDLSWWEAQAKAKGKDLPEGHEINDDAKQAMAKTWARAMGKSLPPPASRPKKTSWGWHWKSSVPGFPRGCKSGGTQGRRPGTRTSDQDA